MTNAARRGALLTLALLITAPAALAQSPPPDSAMRLEEAYALAFAANPRLAAARALVDARAALEPGAGVPPDPTLRAGAMNVSVPGFDDDMPTSMVPSIEAMQMIPWPGKLSLSERIAEQSTAIARAEAAEAWWEVRGAVALAFWELSEADHHLSVMRETQRLLEELVQVTQAMYAAGGGRQSDALRAGVEASRMEAEVRKMAALRSGAAARLNAQLGRRADTPVRAVAGGGTEVEVPPIDALRAWAEASRPLLEGARAEVERARTSARRARRELWPDLTIGVGYGQRRMEDRAGMTETERMASALVGITLPVFARQRQLRMRDHAAAMERMAKAQLAAMRADVDARLVELAALLEQNGSLTALYRTEVLPQARANVESALAAYRAGAVDFMTVIDARMSLNEYEQELNTAETQYAVAVAELEMVIGRALPKSAGVLAEVP